MNCFHLAGQRDELGQGSAMRFVVASLYVIDQFIAAKQAEQKLTPVGPASKEKLLRRAYFDLTGLPPSPEQLEAFLKDDSPQAFERVIDELLGNQHYGERWGRHWLDVARFAESGGYEFDGFRQGAYHYRDWVIRAINDDLPYDEFVRRQLAGDKLHPGFEGACATGFLVAGPYPGQITAKTVERIRYDQLDDMLMTIGGSMLGLTLGCVRCHDHKFDPLPQQDYYGLAAALARTVHGNQTFDPDPDGTEKAIEAHEKAHEPLLAALAKFAETDLPKRFETFQKSELAKQPDAPRWQIAEPVKTEAERSWLKTIAGEIVAHDGAMSTNAAKGRRGRKPIPAEEQYHLTFHTFQKGVTALRLDIYSDKSLPQKGPGLNNDGSFQLLELKARVKPRVADEHATQDANTDPKSADKTDAKDVTELKLKPVFAGAEDKDQPLAQAVDGKVNTAWVVKTTAKRDNAAIFEIDGAWPDLPAGAVLELDLQFRDLGIGRLRVSLSTEANPATWAGDFAPQHASEIRSILAANKNALPANMRLPMAQWLARFDAETAKPWNAVREHSAKEPRPKLTDVYTTIAGGQDVFLLRRGEVDNKQGKADPAFVQVLMTDKDTSSKWTTSADNGTADKKTPVEPRVALAQWITDVDHGAGALLARVIVNRLWQHHFGEGLVGTPNDFGAQGERPSHPELLEYLAGELVRSGWRLKPIHKLMLQSSAYQQSHEVTAANLKIDPTNKYLWHYQPRRLEAEVIRDALLAVGGSLDRTMFGPSVLDNTTRRSVYLRVKRSELIPMMTMFDAPEPTQSIGERVSTTVPTQALAMMNSPLVRGQAERLATKIAPLAAENWTAAIEAAYRATFARTPTAIEQERMTAFLDNQLASLGGNAPANRQRALAEFSHVLLCLNEFVFVD